MASPIDVCELGLTPLALSNDQTSGKLVRRESGVGSSERGKTVQ
jgi:hypothetical protein